MKSKLQAMVLASFAADALALGVHWIYNTNIIDKKYGRLENLIKPELASFHRGKEKGDFTHYGDQAIVLLELLAAAPEFEIETFSQNWRMFFSAYEGYFDSATKETLKNYEAGKDFRQAGSSSDDLAGAARIAPLIYRYFDHPRHLAQTAQAQTVMTHNNRLVIIAAAFFADVTLKVLGGATPREALRQAMAADTLDSRFRTLAVTGLTKRSAETRQAVKDFGQMCEIGAALPATIHLIDKYPDNLKEALVQNILAGGDSAARGMLAGMVLGAYHGLEAIPRQWLSDLTKRQRIEQALARIDHYRADAPVESG